MSKQLHTISLTFSVYEDDMPSELRAKYRQAAIDAMAKYNEDIANAIDESGKDCIHPDDIETTRLIEKMLEDRNR
jgi:hypothetical protein